MLSVARHYTQSYRLFFSPPWNSIEAEIEIRITRHTWSVAIPSHLENPNEHAALAHKRQLFAKLRLSPFVNLYSRRRRHRLSLCRGNFSENCSRSRCRILRRAVKLIVTARGMPVLRVWILIVRIPFFEIVFFLFFLFGMYSFRN